MKKGAELELTITGMAMGGRGLAKPEGFAVFVEGAVPGDTVRARVYRKKKSYAEARVLEILTASADRVAAPCPYSGFCGGCTWQFLDYPVQLKYKAGLVKDALIHIGRVQDVSVQEAIASEKTFGYRNKMEFTCSDRRWLLPEDLGKEGVQRDFALGLHVPGTFDKVLDTRACLLQPDLGNAVLEEVRGSIRDSGIPVYGLRTHQGFWRFVMLRHSVAFDRWMVNLITSEERTETLSPLARHLTDMFPSIVSVVNNISTRKAGIAVGEYERLLWGAPVLQEKIGPFTFEISANSFFQTNTRGAVRLYEEVLRLAELTGKESVLDLYSGTGTIAIRLSAQARQVVGLEIVESAVADAVRNCGLNSVDNCRFIAGDIRQSLSGIDQGPDVMIIDPPRAGMHKDVLQQVLRLLPKRIVYVSCNPATLARDLIELCPSYRIGEVQPVDLFPHTAHIETVVGLRRVR